MAPYVVEQPPFLAGGSRAASLASPVGQPMAVLGGAAAPLVCPNTGRQGGRVGTAFTLTEQGRTVVHGGLRPPLTPVLIP